MFWLSRLGRGGFREAGEFRTVDRPGPLMVERCAPGLAALFGGLHEDGSHSILDLGPAAESSFRLYSRFARKISFNGLLEAPLRSETWTEALKALPERVDEPFDVVLAWNVLDRVPPELRPTLVSRLVGVTVPGARLYVLVDASGRSTAQPLRFSPSGVDMVCQQITGDSYPAGTGLLPAEVRRLLAPFEVVQAFTLKDGFREYVSVRS
jgi:hypothetical protein